MYNETTLRLFLIDFENVKRAGFVGLDNCDEYDKIIILYSDACDTITFDIHQQLMKTKAIVEYQHIKVGGKDSLDHQLSSYLGYLIGLNPLCEFYIISRDRGFEFISDFWAKKNILVEQVLNLNFEKPILLEQSPTITILKTINKQPIKDEKKVTSDSTESITSSTIITALKDFPEYQEQLVKIINENSSKTNVNHQVNKLIPPNKRGSVAKAIRPLIKHYSS